MQQWRPQWRRDLLQKLQAAIDASPNFPGALQDADTCALKFCIAAGCGYYCKSAAATSLELLTASTKFPPALPSGLRLPSRGLEGDRLEASHMRSLACVLPVALLSISDEVPGVPDLIASLLDALEFVLNCTAAEHTIASVADMHKRCMQLRKKLVERFGTRDSIISKDFAFPKFFMLTLFELLAEQLGDASLPDTAAGEMHHKQGKLAFHYTNNRGNKEEQVGGAVCRWLCNCQPGAAVASFMQALLTCIVDHTAHSMCHEAACFMPAAVWASANIVFTHADGGASVPHLGCAGGR